MMSNNAGIYKIVNTTNGKLYVGSSVKVEGRWKTHRHLLKNNKHDNTHLQGAWNKYREESFEFLLIEECEPLKEVLETREQYWIDYYQSCDPAKGYNIRVIAKSNLGIKHTEASKQKISEALRGKVASEAAKERMSVAQSGENGSRTKLTWVKVHEIRRRYKEEKVRLEQLAEEYNVGRSTIQAIIDNRNWKEEGSEKIKRKKISGLCGEQHPNSVVTWNIVYEIRRRSKEENITREQLGIEYGVSKSCIQNIVTFRDWKEENIEQTKGELNNVN